MTDGFSIAEKYQSISTGIGRKQAGQNSNDVVQVTGVSVPNLPAGVSYRFTLAIVSANSLSQLTNQALAARFKFFQDNQSPVPQLTTTSLTGCRGQTVTVTPQGGSQFMFYNQPFLGNPVATGSSYTFQLDDTTNLYITGADSVFESVAAVMAIYARHPLARFTMSPDMLVLDNGTTVTFTDQSIDAASRQWTFTNGLSSNQATLMRSYTFAGSYPIQLAVTDPAGCKDTLTKNLTVVQSITGLGDNVNGSSNSWQVELLQGQGKIILKSSKRTIWQLTNVAGQVIDKGEAQTGQSTINIKQNEAAGLYILRVQQADHFEQKVFKLWLR